ncbi:hypothetical protein [Paenarthrobacter sp. NPDC057981]|uniref:hypothetical protein n=1 Tax=Paenarthrobacter sp. NPDC057981 TaxID=3346297 RepID=UPI0036DE9735
MSQPDLLRPSRDGDQFHYTWAARQSLRLLDATSGLDSLFVEAVDPSEQPDVSQTDDLSDDEQTRTGDEVIDLAEYWGSSNIEHATKIVYRQFKHSTRYANDPWTLSFLTKTLIGFARKYTALKTNHPAALDGVYFEFISNRPPADSAMEALRDLQNGNLSPATRGIRKRLTEIISTEDLRLLCERLTVDERAPSLLKLRHLLDLDVADLLPGAPGEQALLLREMISSRATSVAGDNPMVRRADVLASLKASEDLLLPAPNLIEAPKRSIDRHQFGEIAAKVCESSTAPTLVHGPGGVGKSVLASMLKDNLPEGSVTVVFDCFGNGSYRRPSAPRHRSKQGFVQLVNELAAHALCDPLIPSSTADDADYALAFYRRLSKAAEMVATTNTGALLAIVIDAADNAAMIADEMGERSFVSGLLREQLPQNVRLVATCRTERIDLLGLPAGYRDVLLSGFDLAETRAHLTTVYPDVSSTDASEFHNRTSSNPRVQAAVLDATNNIKEALTWLAPNPGSPGQALDALIERQVAEIRDRQHGSAPEIDAICTGLAALRPMIPIRVLAELAKVHPSVVLSFVADLGRPLLIDGDTVQFRDEPTETWFRDHFRPTGASLDAFIERLSPIAEKDAYVAASLPALLFEASRFDDLVQLALSDDLLPDNALPSSQRNEVQRREIAQQRTHFALSAALRADRHFEAAQLALRLGALTAGRTRRLDLIRENTDLAARFLDPSVLEHLIATRSITAKWPNSNLPIEGALLAGAGGQSDQARNRLRSAMSWMYAWVAQARRNDTPSDLNDLDFLQIAWGLLNTDGPAACTRFLRGWRPRALAFDVGVDIARRLLDAGRDSDFLEFARCSKGKYLKFAIAHAASERDLQLDADIVAHLLKPVLNQDQRPQLSRNNDLSRRNRSADPIHNGLTAASWLINQAVSLEILAADKAAQLLRLYLPQDLGHLSGSWYDPDVWYPILGLTLGARLEGRSADATEFQGPRIREARERERYESSRELRTYRENVEPLTSWAVAWLDLLGNPGPENKAGFSQRISEFLRQEPPEWREERVDQTKINTVFTLIGRALGRFPDIADHAQFLEFQAANDDVIARSTLTNVVRQTAANPLTHRLSSELARRCHQEAAAAREDASELAADFVNLSRATYRISPDEAVVHFQAALEITNAIGDDAWSRWETLLTLANQAGQGTTNQTGKAYRLCQIAESLEPYLGDYLSHSDVLATASRLSLPEALAAGSRWRDRRTATIRDVANAILTSPDLVLDEDPKAALSFLPLGDRFPDNHALASALATKIPDSTSAVITYLQFRRPTPLTPAEQKDLLELTGVTQTSIERNDASLLRTSEDTTYAFPSNERSKNGWDDYKNFDLTTVDGWAKALDHSATGNKSKDLFDYIAAEDLVSDAVLHAFKACPSVSFWDLSRLLDALGNHPLSMGAEAALDQILIAQIPRFAPDILLVSWRAFNYENARTLTNSDTNYETIASRALAEQASFTTEQAYALASNLGRRLPVGEALQLFDLASSYFKDTAPLDSHDGHHNDGMTESWETEAALASVIWTALGDPAGKTRWRAAHSVRLALTLGSSGLVSRLVDLACERIVPTPFLDSRLDFYQKHAVQWLLIGINRATVEPIGLATAIACETLLKTTALGIPHAVNTPLARDSLLRLHSAGLITLSSEEKQHLDQVGKPMGHARHSRKDELTNDVSLADIAAPSVRPEDSTSTPPHNSFPKPAKSESHLPKINSAGNGLPIAPDLDDPTEEERFRFFFDFRRYWCKYLGDAFGITEESIEQIVAEVLIDHWAISSRGRVEDDMRHTLKLYPRDSYASRGEWPEEEDLDFYLAIQGLYEVAGLLLHNRPVILRYDDDDEAGESEYTRFLKSHTLTRDDGRWLSDRRDPAPPNARIDQDDSMGLGTVSYGQNWVRQIESSRFKEELFSSPDQVVVSGFRSANHYSRNERVSINSALVTPNTAPALLRALQTSPDKRAYRIPETGDDTFSSTVPGFELAGWIDDHGVDSGIDSQDPYARSINFPPVRPSSSLAPINLLVPDADLRLWYSGNRIVATSTVWDDHTDTRQTTGSTGHSIVFNRAWLAGMLNELDRWLIVEVQIQRRGEDSSRRRSKNSEDDEALDLPALQTKYFLIDTAGETHES